MNVIIRNGWVIVSEFVTDGIDTWLETQRYLYYTRTEAKALFRDHLSRNGWTIADA